MSKPAEAASRALNPRDRIIVALDVESAAEARAIVSELRGKVGAFKVGLQLFTAAGPEFVRELADKNKVFFDLKFHDIPNTVAKASVEATRLGVWMLNMHTLGGSEMMHTAVNAVAAVCDDEKLERPLMIGVTLLTSSDVTTINEVGLVGGVKERVTALAALAKSSGLDGVVASAAEVTAIRRATGANFLTVTPGIRANRATSADQKRVTTFGRAVADGSDYVVIGRPILMADDRPAAVAELVSDVHILN